MQTVKRAFRMLRRRPELWIPQAVVAVINLLLNTASTGIANAVSLRIPYSSGALFTSGLTLRTPDLLVATETVQLPIVLPSKFVQYTLIVAAVAVTAEVVRSPGLPVAEAARRSLRLRSAAVLNCGLLLIGLVLFDLMCQYAFATGFAYVPALRPDPAWLLILFFWLTDLASYGLFFGVAVPWILTVVLPNPAQHPDEASRHTARLWMFGGWIAWCVFNYLWSRVEGIWLPPRVYPGPFWHAPITLGGPLFTFALLTWLSVLATLVARPGRTHIPD